MLTTWIVLAVLLFWAVGAYNRLVRLRSAALQAFGGLDAHLVQMVSTLGEYEAAQAAQAGNTPADGPHKEARAALCAATTQFAASLAVSRARPLDAGSAAALSTGLDVLHAAWDSALRATPLDAAAEGAVEAVALWTAQREQHRAQNALATRQFNDAVVLYNAAIAQFPARLLAGLFGFRAGRPL